MASGLTVSGGEFGSRPSLNSRVLPEPSGSTLYTKLGPSPPPTRAQITPFAATDQCSVEGDEGRGCQDAQQSSLWNVSCLRPVPSAFIRKSDRRPPSRSTSNTISRPSGDQVGSRASMQSGIAPQSVSFRLGPPVAAITKTSVCPENAIVRPSGDHAGRPWTQLGRQFVSRRTWLPSAFITKTPGRS